MDTERIDRIRQLTEKAKQLGFELSVDLDNEMYILQLPPMLTRWEGTEREVISFLHGYALALARL